MPAKVCPNCDGYYLGIRCESCKWTEFEGDDPNDTDLFVEMTDPPPELPEISDPHGGEAGTS